MASESTSTDRRQSGRRRSDRANRSLVDNLFTAIDPLSVVMLSRERIQETLEEAVERGRMTRSDANALAGELVRRGRQQTEELLAEIERLLEAGPAGRLTEGVRGLARSADRARRSVTGDGDDAEEGAGTGGASQAAEAEGGAAAGAGAATGGLPIPDYDELTARAIQARLGGLSDAQLEQVAEHERRHANRKTVLDAVERALG